MCNYIKYLILLLLCLCFSFVKGGDVIDISGNWKYKLDSEDEGIKQNWYHGEFDNDGIISLPGTTDLAGIGIREENPNPGYLTRKHKYIGAAWYQRYIDIPESWNDKSIELTLERVLWESRVWIDDNFCGAKDSLGTPHVHYSDALKPGRHLLTVRVDNRMIHPIGDRGHCYTEFTQSKWNGIVGRLEMRALAPTRLGVVRLFPDAEGRKVEFEAEIINDTGITTGGKLSVDIVEKSGKIIADCVVLLQEFCSKEKIARIVVRLKDEPDQWDEFSPNLYTANLTFISNGHNDTRQIRFGFRTIADDGNKLIINGRPSFMRGNLDCGQYPLTGHPPMTVEGWSRVYKVCREYGLNQIRFHSWCPPEAAFIAADEMGMYLEPEVLWVDRWMGGPNKRKDMDTPGYPKGVGKADRTIDEYTRAEMKRMLDRYGNHPSFCFFAIGNELGSSDFEVIGEWIREEKERDPRRLYAASTARTITPYDDFSDTHNIPGIGSVVNRLGVDHTNWDYQKNYGRAPVPIIAHEAGQMPVYPDWNEIDKYAGPLAATNFSIFREMARKNGIEHQSTDLQMASGAMNRIIYKNEMEALLRSEGCAGVSWLSMQDFPGQGEALVGWLDTFYESKGIVTPEFFRQYSNTTVPLARFDKFVWTSSEEFNVLVQVSHWGAKALDSTVSWKLIDDSRNILKDGKSDMMSFGVGKVTDVEKITYLLDAIDKPAKLKLEVELEQTAFRNCWDIWVFPDEVVAEAAGDLIVTDDPEQAWAELDKGKRVILLGHKFGSSKHAAWMPLFWSSRFFPGQNRDTLGALVQSKHAAMAEFPTDDHLDWQWKQICTDARGFVLDDQPGEYLPIVQPVSDFHFNHKLGSIFEFKTAKGGKLLVCGYNIVDGLDKRPAARQLRKSLFSYVGGGSFIPGFEISHDKFREYFPVVEELTKVKVPKEFENAVMYVRAGAYPLGKGNVDWNRKVDLVQADDGFNYKVDCGAVWKDSISSAWWGSPSLALEIESSKPDMYDLYVHFHDWNNNGRTGFINFEGREFELGKHNGDGMWVKLNVLREDLLDNRLVLKASCKSGPNLMVSAFALVKK